MVSRLINRSHRASRPLLGLDLGRRRLLDLNEVTKHSGYVVGRLLGATRQHNGTPVFLGCSDVDNHIPLERVHETADVFRRMGARVDARIYPRMGHTINEDELEAVRALLR